MTFKKGESGNPRGRAKGGINKQTVELKSMIMGALDDAGGRSYLLKQARKNPNTFLTLVGKYIPAELHQKLSGAVRVNGTINLIRPGN